MEKLKENKKIVIPLILVALIFILGAAYAWLTTVLNGTQINRIKAGTLDLVLDDNASNGIDLEYAVPQTDTQGLNNQAYTFKVINNGSINAKYTIYLEDEELEDGEERISDSNIKFDLVKNSGESNPRLLSTVISNNRRELDSNVVINGGSTNTYSLRLWIDSEATQEEVGGKVFKGKIKLEAVQTEESAVVTPTITFGTGTTWQPTYFAFGTPTTSDTTPPEGMTVFAAMDTVGNKGVCINRGGATHCFKTNNVEYEQQHVQQVFSDGSCEVDSSFVGCNASGFDCTVHSSGSVYCYVYGMDARCGVEPDGDVDCF